MTATAPAHKPNTSTLLPLAEYDTIILSYSGGKDSLACLLHVLELGADPAKVELWHQHVDGEPGAEGLMDWPCTESYVRATGERREESTSRSRYPEVERHRTSTGARRVDQWRPVIDWSEMEVWDIIRRHRVQPHPAYRLGWGRVSCLACIFGNADQWAGVKDIAPERFGKIAAYKAEFGVTIKRGLTVIDLADKGTSPAADAPQELIDLAMGRRPFTVADLEPEGEWQLPPGAFKRCGGPT